MDDSGEKMSKSRPEFLVEPADLLEGTVKLDGSRKFGYGADVMRLWAAKNDTDKNLEIDREQLD